MSKRGDKVEVLADGIEDYFNMMSEGHKRRVLNKCQRVSKKAIEEKKKRLVNIEEMKSQRDQLASDIEESQAMVRAWTSRRRSILREARTLLTKINATKKSIDTWTEEKSSVEASISMLERKTDEEFSNILQRELFAADAFDDPTTTSHSSDSSSDSSSSSDESSSLSLEEPYHYGAIRLEDYYPVRVERKPPFPEERGDKGFSDFGPCEKEEEEEDLGHGPSEEYVGSEQDPLHNGRESRPRSSPSSFKKKRKALANGPRSPSISSSEKVKKKKKPSMKGSVSREEEEETKEKPYENFYIPVYTFRGSYCFHCGEHDRSLMKSNDVNAWNTYLYAPVQSQIWKHARIALTFPRHCRCVCAECKKPARSCTCLHTFVPLACTTYKLKDYLPKSKGESTYSITSKTYTDLGIMDGTLYDLALKVMQAKEDHDQASVLYEAFIYFWKRYLEHIHDRAQLAVFVSLVFVYSHICGRKKDQMPTRCVYANEFLTPGNVQRGLCTRHKPQISAAREKKWTWITQGKKLFEEWKVSKDM
jgi:hypothetical protein